jgi:Flp pilus assembly CpaE family ATPase
LLPSQSPVSLLDANFQQPDAALQLDCRPEHALTELLIRAHTLEPQIVEACKNVVNSCQNLRLITAALDGSAATRHDKGELVACLPSITASSSVTVIDLPRTLDKSLVMLLDLCQVIVLVVEPNISSIAATRRWLEAFNDLEYPAGKIILAANRLGSKARLLETQLSSSFSLYPVVNIPNAFKSIEASQIEGIPSVRRNPRDPYAKSILALSEETLLRLKVEVAEVGYQSHTPTTNADSSAIGETPGAPPGWRQHESLSEPGRCRSAQDLDGQHLPKHSLDTQVNGFAARTIGEAR